MLFPERWDLPAIAFVLSKAKRPTANRWRRAAPRPRDLLPQPLGIFHFSAASTSPDAGRRADRLGAPRELEDGKAHTFWVAGPAGGGRWRRG